MFPMWTYQPGEADLTVMRVEATGSRSTAELTVRFDVLDKLDPATGFTSMARTTAFPCAIMAREVLAGRFSRRGVIVPEFIGQDAPLVARLLEQQARRGIIYHRSEHPTR
jgi:saccharopine dehydrogenase-like NADP-dependent oxidoreductase